jgi:hypothetical protein
LFLLFGKIRAYGMKIQKASSKKNRDMRAIVDWAKEESGAKDALSFTLELAVFSRGEQLKKGSILQQAVGPPDL